MSRLQRRRALVLSLVASAAAVAMAAPAHARTGVAQAWVQIAQAAGPSSAATPQEIDATAPAPAAAAATTEPASGADAFAAPPVADQPAATPVAAPVVRTAATEVNDPFEAQNRRFYNGSRRADRKVIGPAARAYRRTAPAPVRAGLHNAISNLGEPVVFVNDLLQLRIKDAVSTLGRFCVNSTVGLGGLVDVASSSGLRHHDNDFGVTLGRYGVKPGAYLFLPLLGPSSVRDAVGTGVDYFISPWRLVHYGGERTVGYTKAVVGILDTRANAEEDLEAIDNMSTDPYATTRSLYLQNREALVRGKPVDVNDLPDLDDPAAGGSAPAAEGSAAPTPDSVDNAQPSSAGVPEGLAGALPAPAPTPDSSTSDQPDNSPQPASSQTAPAATPQP